MTKDDAQYLIRRIESMKKVLTEAQDSELPNELGLFEARLRRILDDEDSVIGEDIEMEFYLLLEQRSDLGLAFAKGFASEMIDICLTKINGFTRLERTRQLSPDEKQAKCRWQSRLRSFGQTRNE